MSKIFKPKSATLSVNGKVVSQVHDSVVIEISEKKATILCFDCDYVADSDDEMKVHKMLCVESDRRRSWADYHIPESDEHLRERVLKELRNQRREPVDSADIEAAAAYESRLYGWPYPDPGPPPDDDGEEE